jgi:hypothetical protein
MRSTVRTCAGCRSRKAKGDLIRVGSKGWTITRGDIKLSGRGAYICPSRECVDRARQRGGMDRSLRTRVPDEVYEQVYMVLKESH